MELAKGQDPWSKQAEDPWAKNVDQAAAKTSPVEEWGAFYSMAPRWTKDDGQSISQDGVPSTFDLTKDDSPVKPRPKPPNQSSVNKSGLTDENVGHKLASLLRYRLNEHPKITVDEELGWVIADEVIAQANEVGLQGCTAEDLIRVAEQSAHGSRGKRFECDGAGRIRATYRHPPRDRERRAAWKDHDNSWRDRSGGHNWWQNSSWDDASSKWQADGSDQKSWAQWKKPGFSPAPDDVIVKDSSWKVWEEAPEVEGAVKPSQVEIAGDEVGQSNAKPACDWEQWFTPENMAPYFYNTQTEEVFFPDDAGDCEEKSWSRYVDAEAGTQGKIYWWHEPTSRSFYEEDAIGDDDAAA